VEHVVAAVPGRRSIVGEGVQRAEVDRASPLAPAEDEQAAIIGGD